MKLNIPVNPTYHEVVNDFAKEWEKNRSEKYKEYRSKWLDNPKSFTLEEAPLHLDIEPTSACNLKCPMCPRTVILNDPNRKDNFNIATMPLEKYKQIIDEAVQIGVYSIKLNWLGEPLVHPDIVEMVKYAKEKGVVDVMFNTNAALLKPELSRALIEAGLDKIFFSFDSPHKEKYESIRVGASYEETLYNIKQLMKIRSELGKATPLTRVSMVLMEDNKQEYEEFVGIFKEIVDVVAYVEYRSPEGVDKNQADLAPEFACSQLWQRMFIAADGEIIVCCVDSEKEYKVGNIYKNSIKEIWQNKQYTYIREMHKQGKCFDIGICRKCDLPFKKMDGTV